MEVITFTTFLLYVSYRSTFLITIVKFYYINLKSLNTLKLGSSKIVNRNTVNLKTESPNTSFGRVCLDRR